MRLGEPMFLFLRKKENVFRILLCLYFAYLLWSRLAYLNADSPAYWIDVEEKATAYNARNKVLFGDPSSGGNHYEPMVSSPLPAMVSNNLDSSHNSRENAKRHRMGEITIRVTARRWLPLLQAAQQLPPYFLNIRDLQFVRH